MPTLTRADCFRIALWFVGEQDFHPSERLLVRMPFNEDAIRAALAELRQFTAQDPATPCAGVPGSMELDLVRALRAIRRFCVPDFGVTRIRSLLRDISISTTSVPLLDSLSGFLQCSDVFHAEEAWRVLRKALEQSLAGDGDERVRRILMKMGNATAVLHSWYELQRHLKCSPFSPGALPLIWRLDRKLLTQLQKSIRTLLHCAGHLLSREQRRVLEESLDTLAKLDLPRPHWQSVKNAMVGCLQILKTTNAPDEENPGATALCGIRSLLERGVSHLGRFAVPQTDADITASYDILNELHALLTSYLAEGHIECSDTIAARLANCLEIIAQFLCTMPPVESLTAIKQRLDEARADAIGHHSPKVCALVRRLHQAYQDLIDARREHSEAQAWAAADCVGNLLAEIRESTADVALCGLCDSIESLLDPLAEYRKTFDRLGELEPPPRAAVFASLSGGLDSLVQLLQRTTCVRIGRIEHRVEQLLPLALDPDPLECLLGALGEFREAAKQDAVSALREYGDDVCHWDSVYEPVFDAAQFLPPSGDDLCELREALAMLNPSEIVRRSKTIHPDHPLPEHTLRLLEGLAEYEAGLGALGVFLPEYARVVGVLECTGDPANGPGEFERFRQWLDRQPFRFPAPRLSPLPYADFLAWLAVLPVSQQADVLRVMFIGPWSDAVDEHVQQLIEDKPSIFNVPDEQRSNETAKRRALLILIHALSVYRPFGTMRQVWETICPPLYRRILLPGPLMLEKMLQAVEKGFAAWASACAAGAPGLPEDYPIWAEIASAWNYLLGEQRLSKQLAEGKLRVRSRRLIAAQLFLESVFAGPEARVLEALCPDPRRELEATLGKLQPRIKRFFGNSRRAQWARPLIDDIMAAVNSVDQNSSKKEISPEERHKKRAASRRKHSRIKAEEEIIIAKLRCLLGHLKNALSAHHNIPPDLWGHYRRLRRALCLYRRREKAISELRRKKKEHSSSSARHEIEVLERRIEKLYARLYGLARDIAASYRIIRDLARRVGLPGLENCLERTGRASVDLVYGFARGRRPPYPGDHRRGGRSDTRPRGLQYLILRKAMDDNDELLEELLEPPR